ncbi:hypothetical protein AB4Z17_00205 [Paenibacillus sp. TAF43_2]|uniref:hypothetical protein n=1 Tax=unclassified Paenibacillus TaxID=185978 RepID=UPI003F9AC975
MMALIVLFLFSVTVGTAIWRRNSKKNRHREGGWALVILVIGVGIMMAKLMHLPIPNPADWLTAIFSPVYKPILKWIEEGT